LQIGSGGTFYDNGTIAQTSTGDLLLGSSSSPTTLIIGDNGLYQMESNAGIIDLFGTVAIINAGTIQKTGGGGTSTIQIFGNLSNTGSIEVDSGTLDLNPSTISQVSGDALTGGSWKAFDGATLEFPSGTDITTNAATLDLSGSESNITGISELTSNSSNFTLGVGAVFTTTADFSNTGMLTVAGTLTVSGDYTQSSSGEFVEQLAGLPASGTFGQTQITGAANLDGTFDLAFADGFVPQDSGEYTAITFGQANGSFSTISGVAPDFTDAQTSTAFSLTAVPVRVAQSVVNPASLSVQAGSSDEITLQARDASGNNLTSDGLNVAFTVVGASGPPGTSLPVTDQQIGTYTATFTGDITGAYPVEATINGQPIASPAPTITVIPGPYSLSQSVVELSAPAIQFGGTDLVTLQVKDAEGNDETTGGLSVNFSLGSDSGANGSFSDFTNNHNGTYTAVFTGSLDGNNTIRAGINGAFVTTTAPAIDVTLSAFSTAKSTLKAVPTTVQSGSTTTITLQAENAAGIKESNGGLTVNFRLGNSSAGGLGTFSKVFDNQNGTYSVTFTGTRAGNNTIVATIDGHPVAMNTAIHGIPGSFSLATSVVKLSASSVKSGSAITVTLQAEDAWGNNETTGGLPFDFALGSTSGGLGNFTAFKDKKNGTYTATFTATQVGGNTISGTFDNSHLLTPAQSLTVIPGPASVKQSLVNALSNSVISGDSTTVTLEAVDANGNLETSGGLVVAFGLASTKGAKGKFSKVTDNMNGTYSATFTGTIAGTNTIVATIGGVKVTSNQSMTVTPGAYSLATSTVSVSPSSVKTGGTITVTLQTKDAAGNDLATDLLTSGGSTSFEMANSTGGNGNFSSATYLGNGKYQATFTATNLGSNTIMALIDNGKVTSKAAIKVVAA
jgi:hypothetical protein